MKLLLLGFGLLSFTVLASELPQPVLPDGVGVNIHFVTGNERDLDMIAAAGFKFVRMDFSWNAIERKKGEYDWSQYEELTRNLERRGLSAIYILDYSNSLYEDKVESRNAQKTDVPQRDTASPQHPESIAAYAKWAAAAVKHFHGRRVVWEIWNEPNGFFWKPKPDAAQYSALALAAAKTIRKAEPGVTLVGPALAGFQPEYMETFLQSGVLKYLDAVSVHPYRDAKQGPETVAADYPKLRAMIERYAPDAKHKKLPIICGEWGYSSKSGSISPETQAAFAVRQQLFNLFSGVPLSIWYDWKNDGLDPNEVEHHFGTVTHELKPKPAYLALQVMTQELAGYHVQRRLETGDQDYVLSLANDSGNVKLAAWTASESHEIKVKLRAKAAKQLSGVDGMGQAFMPQVGNGEWLIQLEPLPKYLTLK